MSPGQLWLPIKIYYIKMSTFQFQLAVKFGFLTPLTDMYLEPENAEEGVEPGNKS